MSLWRRVVCGEEFVVKRSPSTGTINHNLKQCKRCKQGNESRRLLWLVVHLLTSPDVVLVRVLLLLLLPVPMLVPVPVPGSHLEKSQVEHVSRLIEDGENVLSSERLEWQSTGCH